MIEYAELFKGIIPLEVLAKFPLRFLHVLRDIRVKQREEMNKRISEGGSTSAPQKNSINVSNPLARLAADPTAIEDLIEELS
jgi:hypothetical protein